jgi:transcriptional regulator with XRE-family HTH domain
VSFSDDDFLLVFIENLRRELKKRGFNQLHIYVDSGVAESVVSRIMQGKDKNPRIQTLCKMAASINIEISSLFLRTTDVSE